MRPQILNSLPLKLAFPPVSCLTKNIPLPSPPPVLRVPVTDFGLGYRPIPGRGPSNILVGLDDNCLVGLSPPPVNWRSKSLSPALPRPVNCRASVVPVDCCGKAILNGLVPVLTGTTGERKGEACRKCLGSNSYVSQNNNMSEPKSPQHSRQGFILTKHSRHHTAPCVSSFAALSSFFPQPALPCSFLLFFASKPPHIRHPECHFEPLGPGTTPHSIGDTAL